MKLQKENVLAAVALLGVCTRGRYNIDMLMGNDNRKLRQHIMNTLVHGGQGKSIPLAQCGVYALYEKFNEYVKPVGSCRAVRERYLSHWFRSVGSGLTDEMYLDYLNNYLTVKKWAEDNNIPEDKALEMLQNYQEIRDDVMGITPKP